MDTTIIILNGASSAGKTTIASSFQEIEATPFLYVSVDAFMHMLPQKWIGSQPEGIQLLPSQKIPNTPSIDIKLGPIAEKLFTGYRDCLLALFNAGNNVITDLILSREQDFQNLVDHFGELRAFLIGVYAPLEVLEVREIKRGEPRGLARGRFDAVYNKKIEYDLFIDTTQTSPRQAAERIQKLIMSTEPRALKSVKKL